MAKRVRKTYKQRQRELDAPEVVEEKLWDLSDWMEANWRPVVGALAAVTVVWGAIGVFQMVTESSEQASAEATAGIFKALAQPVYVKPDGVEGEDPNKPIGPTYGSEKARADAVLAEVAKAEGGEAAALIGVVEGAAKARAGDHAAQVGKLDAALGDSKDSALGAALLQQKASALVAQGKSSEAAAAWQKVADSSKTPFSKAHALIRVGDLYNGRAGAKSADAAKAKAAYGKAVTATKSDGKAPEKGALAFLHAEAQTKLAGL